MAILALYFLFVFVLGTCLGSYLNVCIARLPYEKTVVWPRSCCGSCLQPIRWRDNVPIVSYLALGGKCRTCGATFSIRYLLVELGTGLAFVGLFYLELVRNSLDLPVLRGDRVWIPGLIPLEATPVFLHHALLLCFLIVAAACDLQDMEIPLSLTLWGTFVGLVLATLLPWPYPAPPESAPVGRDAIASLFSGVYPWPVWYPLPSWLAPGTWQLGLATGLAGALAGMVVLRAIRFLFTLGRGIEGMGVGDADLMMMAGAFVGWQPVLIAFFVGVFVGLFFAIIHLIVRGKQMLPFGPALSIGVMLTVLCWPGVPFAVRDAFFDPVFSGLLAAAGAVALVLVSFLLRMLG